MKIEKFKQDYQALIEEMADRMNEPENNREIIDDGVMLPEKYFSNEVRLAWMLKEPYDEEEGKGGGWSYFEMFKGDDLYNSQFRGGHRNTWHPMIYVSYSIHNKFPTWEEMEYIRDDHSMANVVKEVAFINSQKLPSRGVTVTQFNDLHESIGKYSDLLMRQVEMLDPNVFVFANTLHLYRRLLGLEHNKLIENGTCNYINKDGKLYIDAYHPGQKTVGGNKYVNDIVSIVKKWKNGEL